VEKFYIAALQQKRRSGFGSFSEIVENHCCTVEVKTNVATTASYFLVRMIKPGL